MKFSDILGKIIGVFSNQKKTSNIKFIDDSTKATKRGIPQSQAAYGEELKEEPVAKKESEEFVLE